MLRCYVDQMLWELRAEPVAGAADVVLVKMKQVPGYMDFLAEIMPTEVRRKLGALRVRGSCRALSAIPKGSGLG